MKLDEANYKQNRYPKSQKEKTKQNKNPVIPFNIKEGGRSIRAVSHNPIAKA
jgi:hypothetical protein